MATVRHRPERDRGGLDASAGARLDALTPDEIEENARTDPDNPPLTEEELARGVFGRRVRRTRKKLGLTQKEFSARFNINLRGLQDWEQGRFAPDSVILAYLKIIDREPELVERILAAA